MTHVRFKAFTTAVAVFATMLMTACGSTGTPQDGRYQTHDGGRSNFRAEAPMPVPQSWCRSDSNCCKCLFTA